MISWFSFCTPLNNGMLRHSLVGAVIFIFFAALYCSCLGFNALLALTTKEGGNKGIKSKKGAIKCCKEIKITAMI